ncbi:MAG: hypothetical protein AB7U48_08505 [Bauldia sp.]
MSIKSPLPQTTNAEDWVQTVAVTDEAGGFDLSPYAISIRVTDDRGAEVLAGSTGDGGVVVSNDADDVPSLFTSTFRAATMAALRAGTYTVGVRITDGTNTNQIILSRRLRARRRIGTGNPRDDAGGGGRHARRLRRHERSPGLARARGDLAPDPGAGIGRRHLDRPRQ